MDKSGPIIIGEFVYPKESCRFDLSSTFRLRAKSIDQNKLWASKDRSAEFMGDIWELFIDSEKEARIKTVLHSICVELIENAVKYGCQDHDYLIIIELCLKKDLLLVYVMNNCHPEVISELEAAARLLLNHQHSIPKLFKQKLKEAKAAKKKGVSRSQLGFLRILMQNVSLAWQIEKEGESAIVTTLAKVPLTEGQKESC